MFLSICYASTFIFSFLHVRTFKIYFVSYNLSTCAPPSLFSICYIYQLTHVTSPCLALLAYHLIKTLNRIAVISLSLSLPPSLMFAFLTFSTVFPFKRHLSRSKKIDMCLCDHANLRSAFGDSRDATVASVTR